MKYPTLVVMVPGQLVGAGRSADVFAYGSGLVLRRYRTPHDTKREAAVMRYAREHGFPVPAVHEATATDLVMDRIDGPTMLADLTRQPWRVSVHAALLARLHRQLHAIPAPLWLPAPFTEGDVLVHFDLHPQNVLLSEHGPVVIDWPNAIRGHGEHDVALTWIILQTAVVPGKVGHRLLAGLMRGLFLRSFLRHFDRSAVARQLSAAATRWLRDRNVQPAEREAITRLLQRAAAGCG